MGAKRPIRLVYLERDMADSHGWTLAKMMIFLFFNLKIKKGLCEFAADELCNTFSEKKNDTIFLKIVHMNWFKWYRCKSDMHLFKLGVTLIIVDSFFKPDIVEIQEWILKLPVSFSNLICLRQLFNYICN